MTGLRLISLFLLLATSLVGCSGPLFPIRPQQAEDGPPTAASLQYRDWALGFTRLRVVDAQEDRRLANFSISNGDEPYLIVLAFKGDVGIQGSVQMFKNRYEDDEWAENTRAGRTVQLPDDMAILRFNDVTRNSVIGVLAIAMESDRTPWPIIADRVADISGRLNQAAVREIEERASLDPSDTAFLDNLHQSMIEAANPLATSLSAGQAIENLIFSGIDTDEVIGVNALILMQDPPTQDLRLPHYIPPYFTDALAPKDYSIDSIPLIFENGPLKARYHVELKIRQL